MKGDWVNRVDQFFAEPSLLLELMEPVSRGDNRDRGLFAGVKKKR